MKAFTPRPPRKNEVENTHQVLAIIIGAVLVLAFCLMVFLKFGPHPR